MLHYRAAVASQQIHSLAEGPLWDAPRRRVLWVDINAGKVHSGTLDGTSPGGDRILPDRVISIPGTAGAVVCSPAGELLVAGARTLHTVAGDGTVTAGPQLVPADRPSRLKRRSLRSGRPIPGRQHGSRRRAPRRGIAVPP